MKYNQMIEDARKTRDKISKKCDYDPKKLVDYYIEKQEQRKLDKRNKK